MAEIHQQSRASQSVAFESSRDSLVEQHTEELKIIDERIATLLEANQAEEVRCSLTFSVFFECFSRLFLGFFDDVFERQLEAQKIIRIFF